VDTNRFITVHLLHALPMHNLNRDQNGLPKSTYDGGAQRGRLSSQSLKRAARVGFRDSGADPVGSIRTREGAAEITDRARILAAEKGLPFNEKKVTAEAKRIVAWLTDKADEAGSEAEDPASELDTVKEKKQKATVLFYSRAEIETVAAAIIDGNSQANIQDAFIKDASSPSLDVAAFGRMFASKDASSKSTLAAIARSNAVTTHQMTLTSDYFTAMEERDSKAAAHMNMAYYTSGVYYSSFAINVNQLQRSWAIFGSPGAKEQLHELVKQLITALPSGRSSNTAPYIMPAVVLAESQRSRTDYAYEKPVPNEDDGGFLRPSAESLVALRSEALEFDRGNFGPSAFLVKGAALTDVSFEDSVKITSLDAMAAFVVEKVYEGREG